MTCVTCHDPHNGFREQGPAYFNDKCLSCHTDIPGRYSEEPALANHRRDTNCFTCHMPRVEAQNAPHASFTDHWIRVVTKSDSTEYAASVAGPELVPLLKENADLNAAARDLGLAHIILGEQKAGEASIVRGISILDTTLTVDPSHGEAQFLYGRALLKIGRIGAAIDALELANKLDARIPERLQELGWAYEIDDRATSLSETLYEEALSIQPQNAEIRVRLAELLEADNRLEAALTEYVKAADEQPWLESAHYGLGTTAFALGRLAQAESAFREVLRLNPDFANALTNLGAIMILEKNLDEAMGLFERAVAVEPINVAALGNLGLVYAQLGRYREARDRLQQVLLLAPEDQQARAALAEVRRLMQ